MALVFNTPPNWPQKPRGWRPEPGWEPDPQWDPAPENWQFWSQEDNRETEAVESVEPAESSELSELTEPVISTQPAEPVTGNAIEEFSKPEIAEPAEGSLEPVFTENNSVEESAIEDPSHSVPEDTDEVSDIETSKASEVTSLNKDSIEESPALAESAMAETAATSSHVSAREDLATLLTTDRQPQLYPAPGKKRAVARAAKSEPRKKKTGLLLGTAAALLALVAGGIALATQTDNKTATTSTESSVAASTLTSPAPALQSASDTASSASSAQIVPGTPKSLSGEYNGYSGNGLQVFDMIIPGGAGAYYTYTFQGKSEDSKFSLQGMNEVNEPNIYSRSYQGKALSGSGVFDVVPGGSKTFKVEANGDGEWTLKLFPLSSTPSYKKGETISGDSPEAFFYEGDSSDLDVRFVPKPGSSTSSFSLQSNVDEDPEAQPVLEATQPTVKKIKVEGGQTLFWVYAKDGAWSVTFQ